MKKAGSNELKDLIRKLSELNKKLENYPNDDTRKELLESRELYNSKYEAFFKRLIKFLDSLIQKGGSKIVKMCNFEN